ncbi:MAG TPA: MFS transporter [Gemmatimonadales bacterium]
MRVKLAIIAALYFAQGFPYGAFAELLPTFLRFQGVDLAEITELTARLGLAWTLKFLWAPLVDQIGTRRSWILGAQLLLAASLASIALLQPTSATPAVWIALGALTFLSATQDIAIDAYGIELLEEREYGAANGVRVAAYRVALIATGGLLVATAGRTGWTVAFWIATGVMLLMAAITLFLPNPDVKRHAAPAAGLLERTVWHPLRTLAVLPGFAALLLFVMTFKMGDFALLVLIRPFWVDSGYSPEAIGLVLGTVGMLATIGGALLGGALTTRWGIFHALWILGLTQAFSNLGYYLAAVQGASVGVMYTAAIVEQFTNGLGTAAFLAFLMALCDRRFAATQYALLTAIYGLGRFLVMDQAGALAQSVGYETYFLITLALAFPAFLLLPWVRRAMEARRERSPVP